MVEKRTMSRSAFFDKTEEGLRVVKWITCILLVALAIEICVFNYRSLESLTFSEIEYSCEGASAPGGGYVVDADNPLVIGIDKGDLKNLKLVVDGEKAVGLKVLVADEGHAQPYAMASETIRGTDYLRLHAYGTASRLLIELAEQGAAGSEVSASVSVELNTVVPLDISKKRIFVVTDVIALGVLLRPNSILHKRRFSRRLFQVILAGCLAGGVVCGCIVGYNPEIPATKQYQHQYYDLARALADGHLYLDDEPSEKLMGLENPYDTNDRVAQGLVRHHDFLWDHAYYDGKYYVYFGVLPALLFHLPFYLLTGGEFPNWVAVAIVLAGFAVGVVFLLGRICRRWFPGCSQALFLLLSLTTVLGSWIVYLCRYPDMYALPIALGLALQVWGLALWISATTNPIRISISHAVAGSVCMALVVACRPQMLIGGLLGLALIIPYLKRSWRKSIGFVVVALIPFAVVFAAVGMYNVARFGSPFDFGANYNLTTNDMIHRGFELDRLPLAFFAYLFQPPNVDLATPYIHSTSLMSDYYGQLVKEGTMIGGVFLLTPVLLAVFLLAFRRIRSAIHSIEGIASMVASLVVAGIVLVAFDANGAGILARYYADFGFYFAVAAALLALSVFAAEGGSGSCANMMPNPSSAIRSVSVGVFTLLALASLFVQLVWLLVGSGWLPV